MSYDGRIVVIDLECTCWDTPQPEESEIIQVGICLLDPFERVISRERSFLCRPNGTVSDYCTNLTGITDKQVRKAARLNEVFNTIKAKYPIRSCPWASWGIGDLHHLRAEMARKGFDYPMFDGHIDISFLFSIKMPKLKRVSLQEALEACGIEPVGTWHDAMSDAVNAAKIMCSLFPA